MKNTAIALLLSSAVIGSSALAAGAVETGKTRAEVVAELAQARAAGELAQGELGYPFEQASGPVKSRAQVVAELEAAEAAGLLPANSIDYPPVAVAAQESHKTRAQVVNELVAARANGELPVVTF